ncbi:hypothetical protein PVAND_009888 [Polypedilum vanderplanki]|uniref:methylated diphthine methylhydrolase n=1 Tax=Polypedilum vanderplanki TaxID=319348 RepID=A0A9J6CF30_POLVA|nr:hypothetical protein PVAND_009888 [Polypedilum vanderplanki]
MQNYTYDNSSTEHYIEDKKIFAWNTNPYQLNFELKRETPSTPNYQEQNLTRSQLAHLRESPAAREHRLARNAERMREKRARESDEERRRRLDKNALNNRLKRLNESPTEKAIRQVRDAARQRLRRAMESQEQRDTRLRKLAERMRQVRRNESPDKKAERLSKAAQRARDRLQRETSEERRQRLQKGSEYARRVRSKKSTTGSSLSNDTTTSDTSDHNLSSSNLGQIYHNPTNSLKIPQHQHNQNNHHMQNIYDNSPAAAAAVVASGNYNFVNFNNSLSALAFNHTDASSSTAASSLTQPVNNSLITLNIPHYHTVFSQTHQNKIPFNTTAIKDEFYPKINQCDNMNQLKHHHNAFQNHVIKTENNLSNKPNEQDQQRLERLRKTAEMSRLRRNNETPEQRTKRLNDLKERARKRRDAIKQVESEDERKIRLAKQAEYARSRRQKETSRSSFQRIGETQSLLNLEKPSITTNIQTLCTFDTEYSADSVEWYSKENIFAVGTYQLDDDNNTKSTRKGRIYLFKFDFASGDDNGDHKLEKIQQIETDAILDQKWFNNKLVTVSSLGNVETYEYLQELTKVNSLSLINEGETGERLALSIDVEYESYLISDSKGQLSLVDINSNSISSQWKAHDFEAWTCSFDRWNKNVIYSGGDDSCFHLWDIRTRNKIKTKNREAGVTSFLNHQENLLFVGSYDENLCLYDMRNLKQTVNEINLHGGIWRIKKSPINDDLLVACMYHNFSIVNCTNGSLSLIGEYNEHKSICYGCHWSYQIYDNNHQIFATCSFYDHRLSVCLLKHI